MTRTMIMREDQPVPFGGLSGVKINILHEVDTGSIKCGRMLCITRYHGSETRSRPYYRVESKVSESLVTTYNYAEKYKLLNGVSCQRQIRRYYKQIGIGVGHLYRSLHNFVPCTKLGCNV